MGSSQENKMSKTVVVTMKDNGKFTVVGEEGTVNYGEKELLRALEEVVYQIRKKRPLLKVASADVDAHGAEQAPARQNQVTESNDKISEEYYNGGLGPRISNTKTSGMGFGVG